FAPAIAPGRDAGNRGGRGLSSRASPPPPPGPTILPSRLPAILTLPLTPLDLVALALLALAWFGTARIVEHPPARLPSVSVLMKTYRRDWMRQFVHRDPRIFD